ncbi:MAG: hypothetical protein KIY11_08170 [Thermoplasmata archaeon]|nr:hypothetical protein [Candidatus Sysuiplasma acidicola]
MNQVRKTVSVLSLLVLVEYVLGGFVTFDDPSDAGFQLNSFILTGQGVLPLIHRIFAAVMIVAWVIGLRYLKGTAAYRMVHATLALMVVQSVIGALIPATLAQPLLNAFVIIAHFSFSGLVLATTGFTFYFGWVHKPVHSADGIAQTLPESS